LTTINSSACTQGILEPAVRDDARSEAFIYLVIAMTKTAASMSIGSFCSRSVVYATRDARIVEAATLMRQGHVGDVVVIDDLQWKRPVGIVTDRDIAIEVVAAGLDAKVVKIGDLLHDRVVTVEENAGYAETIDRMTSAGVRRVPVVDAGGLLVGIVTLDDLLQQLAFPLAQLAKVPVRGRQKEMQARR
jgi:CBS domain-containing protein